MEDLSYNIADKLGEGEGGSVALITELASWVELRWGEVTQDIDSHQLICRGGRGCTTHGTLSLSRLHNDCSSLVNSVPARS